jgi:HemY protein
VADAATAQARAVRAKTLLGETPLVLLLTAEAARLAGDAETAAVHFEKLTADKALGFAGHHGLLRHSLAVADHDKAAVHATTAARKFPGSAWVQKQRLHLAVAQKHWADGLAFTNDPAEIAALGSAAAQVADPRQGVKLAQAALRAVPGFAPALVAYAAALRALGKERAARGVLKNGFKGNPHPLIAAAYVAGFGTPIERAQAAQSLAAVAPAQGESALIQAQTALAADLPGEARRHAHDAIAAGMTDARPLAVLAALEGKPAPAAPVPGWICEACNTKSENWVPVCPHCQKLGGMAWRALGTALAVLPPDRLLT